MGHGVVQGWLVSVAYESNSLNRCCKEVSWRWLHWEWRCQGAHIDGSDGLADVSVTNIALTFILFKLKIKVLSNKLRCFLETPHKGATYREAWRSLVGVFKHNVKANTCHNLKLVAHIKLICCPLHRHHPLGTEWSTKMYCNIGSVCWDWYRKENINWRVTIFYINCNPTCLVLMR